MMCADTFVVQSIIKRKRFLPLQQLRSPVVLGVDARLVSDERSPNGQRHNHNAAINLALGD
jgi:hypothetical protein